MRIFEETLPSYDGQALYCRTCLHPFARGLVVVVHSFGEHTLRYQALSDGLYAAGFSVLGFDLRNHGRSDGPRGVVANHEALVADLEQVLQRFVADSSPQPLFLLGHGTGSGVVAQYAYADPKADADQLPSEEPRQRPLLRGMILLAPGHYVCRNPFRLTWRMLMGKLLPDLPLIQGLGSSFAYLAEERSRHRLLSADPMVYRGAISAMTRWQLSRWGVGLKHHLKQLHTPSLVLQGSHCEPSSTELAEWLYEQLCCEDKTYALYEGDDYSVFDGDGAFAGVLTDWLLARSRQDEHATIH